MTIACHDPFKYFLVEIVPNRTPVTPCTYLHNGHGLHCNPDSDFRKDREKTACYPNPVEALPPTVDANS